MTGSTAIDDLDASRGHDKDGDSFSLGLREPRRRRQDSILVG